MKLFIACLQLAKLCDASDLSPAFFIPHRVYIIDFLSAILCQATVWHLIIFQHDDATFINLWQLWKMWIQMQIWNRDLVKFKLWYAFELTPTQVDEIHKNNMMLKKDLNSNLHKRMYKGAIAKETDPSQRPLCNQAQDRVLHGSRTKPGTFVAPGLSQ